MAIKRLTIELDDSSDRVRPTSIPEGLQTTEGRELTARDSTSTPSEREDEETNSPAVGAIPPRAPQRTFADLIAEFVNDPRAMATVLMFGSFLVFIAKVDAIFDLIYPVVMGVILNAVWFGIPLIQRLFRRKVDT